jgi:hypothetical protein
MYTLYNVNVFTPTCTVQYVISCAVNIRLQLYTCFHTMRSKHAPSKILNDIGINSLLGYRKKIAKFFNGDFYLPLYLPLWRKGKVRPLTVKHNVQSYFSGMIRSFCVRVQYTVRYDTILLQYRVQYTVLYGTIQSLCSTVYSTVRYNPFAVQYSM